MSTYAKAWLFNGLWTVFALIGLYGLFEQAALGVSNPLALGIGIAGYFLCIFLAGHFPKCLSCGEPVNDARVDGNARDGHVVRPDRPRRECGYCGQDLTRNSLPE